MALQASGVSVKGRVITSFLLTSGATYTFLFPNKPLLTVVYYGVAEVLQKDDPFAGDYSQRQVLELWTRAHRLAVGTIPANNFLGFTWRVAGIPWELHR